MNNILDLRTASARATGWITTAIPRRSSRSRWAPRRSRGWSAAACRTPDLLANLVEYPAVAKGAARFRMQVMAKHSARTSKKPSRSWPLSSRGADGAGGFASASATQRGVTAAACTGFA